MFALPRRGTWFACAFGLYLDLALFCAYALDESALFDVKYADANGTYRYPFYQTEVADLDWVRDRCDLANAHGMKTWAQRQHCRVAIVRHRPRPSHTRALHRDRAGDAVGSLR